MGISYYVMEFRREVWTRKFQRESITPGRFMMASIIPYQLIVLSHILIHPILPLVIDPACIKYPNIPPDLLPSVISIASENSVNTFNTPSNSQKLLLLNSDDPNNTHVMNKDEPYSGRVKRGYCSRKFDKKYAKKTRFYSSMCSDKDKKIY